MKIAAFVVGFTSLLALPAVAHAQLVAAADGGITVPKTTHEVGYESDVRFGFRFGLWRAVHFHTVLIQPEIVASDLLLHKIEPAGANLVTFRRSGGLRAGFAIWHLDVFGYMHAGLVIDNPRLRPTYDYGGALDYRWSCVGVSLGGHFGRAMITDNDRARWIETGLHLEYHWFAW